MSNQCRTCGTLCYQGNFSQLSAVAKWVLQLMIVAYVVVFVSMYVFALVGGPGSLREAMWSKESMASCYKLKQNSIFRHGYGLW